MTTELFEVNYAAQKLHDAEAEQQEAFEHMEHPRQAQSRAITLLTEPESGRDRALTPFLLEAAPRWIGAVG